MQEYGLRIFGVVVLSALWPLAASAQNAGNDTSLHYLTSPVYQQRYQPPSMPGQPPLYDAEVISVSPAQNPKSVPPSPLQPVQAPTVYQPVANAAPPAPVAISAPQPAMPAAAPPVQHPVAVAPSPSTQMHPANLATLPSYTYKPELDPRNAPYSGPAPRAANKSSVDLGTSTGAEIGLQIADYRYQEHLVAGDDFMHETGPDFGLTFDGFKAFPSGFFLGGDVRAAYGALDYTGSGTLSGVNNWTFDGQLLGGYDFFLHNIFGSGGNMSLSPYSGFGYRWLDNDLRGTTSTGAAGYERYSHYFYLPVGVTPRFRLTDNMRLSLNGEFDWLLFGWEKTELGDAIPGASDITNDQHDGYGLRGSLMVEWPSWSFGPFFDYWNINQSDLACDNVECGVEPHNQTIEYGLQGRYRF